MNYLIYTPTEAQRLIDEGKIEQTLVLEEHAQFHGQWLVQCVDRGFYYDFHDIIGPYQVVSPLNLPKLFERAGEAGYEILFGEDPTGILDTFARLSEVPEVSIVSSMPGTVNGFLPYQVQGFNFLKGLDYGVVQWSTGTGKTVGACGLVKFHAEHDPFDLCWFVVKSHNKINTARSLERLVGIDAVVLDGEKKRREALYAHLADVDDPTVVVTNYEKFRVDHEAIRPLFDGRSILCIWDEMPTKLKTRSTKVYKSVCECLYRTAAPVVSWDKKRPKKLRQYMLSATPIENDPEDWFNTIRLLDGGQTYGTVKDFRDAHVAKYSFFDPSKPEVWKDLDKIGLKAAHFVHQVDKQDPDIAKQFPAWIGQGEPYVVDWDPADRKLYDRLLKKSDDFVSELGEDGILSLIHLMEMLCCAPSMVTDSAVLREVYESAMEEWAQDTSMPVPSLEGSAAALKLVEAIGIDKFTDERHTKIDTLRQILTEDHPDEKVVIFSSFNKALLPILERHLTEWGVSYVRYSGTMAQRQKAQDAFCNDPSVRVFLSSDAGSDSINLEQASVVVHYNLPWKWATMIQRENRIHRVTSTFDTVRVYTLVMADSVEDRKLGIIQRKQSYHEAVFKGVISEQSQSARMSKDDLLYMLKG